MAKHPLSRLDLESIRQLARQWGRDLVRQQWGERGRGVDVTPEQLEEVAMAAVNGILDGTLEVAAEVDARRLGAAWSGPDRKEPFPVPRGASSGDRTH